MVNQAFGDFSRQHPSLQHPAQLPGYASRSGMAAGAEFALIEKYFTRLTPHTDLGIGDDAALVTVTPGHQLVVSADSLVAGCHFFPTTHATSIGWKSLAVNLSDMAAMGARPRWFTLCLTMPAVDQSWIAGFSQGLFAIATEYGVELIGGDITAGPLSISIQILGEVPASTALTRSGARAGDQIWLSGATGAAALAVLHRQNKLALPGEDLAKCAQALDFPIPQIALGQALRGGMASAAIDISDGLLADLGHLARRSNLGATLHVQAMPRPILSDMLYNHPAFLVAQLTGGDDYQLCFTASPNAHGFVQELSPSLGVPLHCIGVMHAGSGVVVCDAQGREIQTSSYRGYEHFS